MSVDFAAALGERREAYERLLDDALAGEPAALRPSGHRRADVADRAARRSTIRGRCTPMPAVRGGRSPKLDRVLEPGDRWIDPDV